MLQASLPPDRHAGGVGFQVDMLATALVRRGHQVTVFVIDNPPTDKAYECVQVVSSRSGGGRVLGAGRAYSRLNLTTYDVVHAHGDDWLFRKRPRIRTFYGSALMEALTAKRWRRRLSQLCYYMLELVTWSNPNTVAISSATRRYLPFIDSCVPCAFDPTIFFPGGERTLCPSILFVAGTLSGRKRGDLLLKAFRRVRELLATAQLTIVSRDEVAGPGITCRSDVNAEELGALYRSHWLLCSTSSYEGFGVPYVEALASGLPVVTTPNDGAKEVLNGGGLGVISSPEHLASSMVSLLSDAKRRRELASQGLEAAWRYSLDEVVCQYERLYEAVGRGGRIRSVAQEGGNLEPE